MAKPSIPGVQPNIQLDSTYMHPQQKRTGFVQGESDMPYGGVSGFRYGLESTGNRHKKSSLGKKVKG